MLVDLAQRDREGLLVHLRVDEGPDILKQPLLELGVIGVDLAGPLGGVDDQRILAVRVGQQVIDGRAGDAGGVGRVPDTVATVSIFGYG